MMTGVVDGKGGAAGSCLPCRDYWWHQGRRVYTDFKLDRRYNPRRTSEKQ